MVNLQDLDRAPTTSSNDNGLLSQISDNPFFTGGVGLAVLGTVIATSQRGIRYGALALRKRLLVSTEITHKSKDYPHLLQWLEQHHRNQRLAIQDGSPSKASLRERLLSLYVPRIHDLSYTTKEVSGPHGTKDEDFEMVPGIGHFFMRYKTAFFKVDRTRKESMDLTTGNMWETVRLTTLYSQEPLLREIMREVRTMGQKSTEGKLTIYTPTVAEWIPLGGEPEPIRPLHSVVLDKGISETVVADLSKFLASSDRYRSRGVPYRRGYLLHGTPGTGKTSFVQALAGAFNFNIAVLSLSERGLHDARLALLLVKLPPRTFVLIEDVDAAFTTGREQSEEDGYQSHVTFAGLLNALDGVTSRHDRITFLTTNHVERLDAALKRPGRVDVTVRFGHATRWQAGEMWDRFYPETMDDEVGKKLKEGFLEGLEERGHLAGGKRLISPAALQGLFLCHDDPEGVVSAAEGYFEELTGEGEGVEGVESDG